MKQTRKYEISLITAQAAFPPNSYTLAPSATIEVNGVPKKIRFIPNASSIFVDVQEKQGFDEDLRGESIEIPTRGMTLSEDREVNKRIIEYINAYPFTEHNSSLYRKKARIRIVELTEQAKKEVNDILNLTDLINTVASMREADIRKLAYLLGKVTDNELKTEPFEIVRKKVFLACNEDVNKVNSILKDDLKEYVDIVIDAFEVDVLVKANAQGSEIYDEVGRTFVKDVLGNSAIRAAAKKIKEDEGLRKALEKKIQERRAGFTSEDEIDNAEYLLAEKKIKETLEVSSYEDLVDYVLDNYAAAPEKSPLERSGNFYKLGGVALRAIKPDGSPLVGKEGARTILIQDRYKHEPTLKIELAKRL